MLPVCTPRLPQAPFMRRSLQHFRPPFPHVALLSPHHLPSALLRVTAPPLVYESFQRPSLGVPTSPSVPISPSVPSNPSIRTPRDGTSRQATPARPFTLPHQGYPVLPFPSSRALSAPICAPGCTAHPHSATTSLTAWLPLLIITPPGSSYASISGCN